MKNIAVNVIIEEEDASTSYYESKTPSGDIKISSTESTMEDPFRSKAKQFVKRVLQLQVDICRQVARDEIEKSHCDAVLDSSSDGITGAASTPPPSVASRTMPASSGKEVVTVVSSRCNVVVAASCATSTTNRVNLLETKKEKKDSFLIFLLVLQEYLIHKDPDLHRKVREFIEDCSDRCRYRGTGYGSVTASMATMQIAIKDMITEAHWKCAQDYLKRFLWRKNRSMSRIVPVATAAVVEDDIRMVDMAERMFKQQEAFAAAGIKLHVDIGFHYTKGSNMDQIRKNGLLTRKERQKMNMIESVVGFNGARYGDGIYTGNNPFAYSMLGDVGILVARLQGNACSGEESDNNNKSIVGGPWGGFSQVPGKSSYTTVVAREGFFQVVVLRQCSHCIPLAHFPKSMINVKHDNSPENLAIHYYQSELQKIVDEFFNTGVAPTPTIVKLILPSHCRKA